MKVWVAAFWYLYDDPDEIVGVFSSKELAEAALVQRRPDHWTADGSRIDEYTLDEIDEYMQKSNG